MCDPIVSEMGGRKKPPTSLGKAQNQIGKSLQFATTKSIHLKMVGLALLVVSSTSGQSAMLFLCKIKRPLLSTQRCKH